MPTITELTPTTGVRLKITARAGFVAPPGYLICSVDFTGQELYIAGWVSQDEKILRSFLVNEFSPLLDANGQPVIKDGKEVFYKNPDADLHTLTCKMCCYPQLFEGKPEHEWFSIAKDASLIKGKNSPRDVAKRLNFGILYMQTAKAMSELYHEKEETCANWISKHQKTYPQFHRWAKEIGNLSNARGWSRNPDSRIRFVAEDNAKAQGASAARSGVNFQIQGYGSSQIKLSELKCLEAFRGTKAKLSMLVHDELVCCIPGQAILDPDKAVLGDNNLLKPYYKLDDEAKHWMQVIQRCMEDSQKETFGGLLEGRAEATAAPVWSK